VKAEAERLRQQREMQHEEEFSELKLAEEELVQVDVWAEMMLLIHRMFVRGKFSNVEVVLHIVLYVHCEFY